MSQRTAIRLRSAGFTLIELLVAVVLALLIGVAIASIYLGSTQSFRTSTGLAQLQEGGRFASLLVTPVVRQAGYLSDPVLSQTDPTTVFLSGNYQNAVSGYDNSGPSFYPSFSSGSVKSGTDVLAVAFVGQGTSTSDSPLRSCLGTAIYSGSLALNVLYVSAQSDASGVYSLNCYTNVTAVNSSLGTGSINNQPLVQGVTDMQILYGIDTKNDGTAISYYTASQVNSLSTPPAGFTNPWLPINPWLAVTQVQITYTVDSADTVEIQRAGQGNVTNQGRLRSSFTTTIDLRNRFHN